MRVTSALILLAALSRFACAGTSHAESNDARVSTVVASLESSPNVAAFLLLSETKSFTSPHVGPAGSPSEQVAAFRTLLGGGQADYYFKRLIAESGIAGQLYGLSGLYWTDRSAFESAVPVFAALTGAVHVRFGCAEGHLPIAAVVQRSDAIQMSRGETASDWRRRVPFTPAFEGAPLPSPQLHIAGGGWPTTFGLKGE